jgi:hypothetical protein
MMQDQLQLNERAVRLVSGMVVLISLAVLITGSAWLALYMSFDFFCRAFTAFRPPLSRLGNMLANALNQEPKWIYAPPKKFAAALGFVFSLGIFFSFIAGFVLAGNIIAVVLISCAILESVFGICAGCYVYDWFVVPLRSYFDQKHEVNR